MMFNPKNILVTGGAGFIGSHFIIYLLKHYPDIHIVNLDKLSYAANLNNLRSVEDSAHYQFIKGDICDTNLIPDVLMKFNIDTIVNFAAESHVDNSIANPLLFTHNNILGTHNLLEAAYQYWQKTCDLNPVKCRFHQISTDEVYGSLSKDEPAFTEISPYRPNSPYAASKAASDHLVRAYQQTFKLPTTLSNCSNNFGAHQHPEKLIPKIIHRCSQLQKIPLYHDGSNIRDWIFVDDHCHAIDVIVRDGKLGQHYNVGANNEWSNLAIAQFICQEMDKLNAKNAPHERLISFVRDRPGHDFRYALDSSLLEATTERRVGARFEDTLSTLIRQKLI